MMKAVAVVLLSLVVGACVTNASSESGGAVAATESPTLESVVGGKAKTQPKVICTREKPTGSHRTIRTCRTVASLEHERAAAREDMRVLQRQSEVLNR